MTNDEIEKRAREIAGAWLINNFTRNDLIDGRDITRLSQSIAAALRDVQAAQPQPEWPSEVALQADIESGRKYALGFYHTEAEAAAYVCGFDGGLNRLRWLKSRMSKGAGEGGE